MIFSALVVGCVAAYYFGLQPGVAAAAATFLLGLVAMFLPRYALTINICIAAAVFVMWQVGSRRPTPTQSVLAVRWVRAAAKRLLARFR